MLSLFLALLTALPSSPPADAGTVVEEVVAVVGQAPILTSDVELAQLVHLVEPIAGESQEAYRTRLLDLRVRLELQYRDLESSGTLYRLEPDLESSLIQLTERAGGKEALHDGLEQHGLSWDDLEHLALRIAVVNTYVEQRLRPRISVSTDELQREYRLLTDTLHNAGSPVPPFEEVHGRLFQLLQERKLNAEIERWIEQSRERIEVTRFVP